MTKSVRQLLFDGFQVTLLNDLSKLKIHFENNTFGYMYNVSISVYFLTNFVICGFILF